MAILTESGRIAVAHYISEQPLHMAWGNGNEEWDTAPIPATPVETLLVSEVGRLRATRVQFAEPDLAGEVVLPEGAFNISPTPTKYLMLSFDFDYGHAVGERIRELGVFVGTTLADGILPDTAYLTPAQLDDQGRMLVVERVVGFTRASNTRQKFTYVIQF